MSRDTLATLKRHLQEKKQSIILNIIQEHLYFDMYEGMSRTKQQIDSVAGSVIGEATRAGKFYSNILMDLKGWKVHRPFWKYIFACHA